MSEPLLPPLRDDDRNQLGVFPATGTWDRRDAVALAQLARSLRVSDQEPLGVDIDSIPSMWARPLLFEMALFDEHHVLHDRTVGEWRGLIALLVLRQVMGIYGLSCQAVTLTDDTVAGKALLRTVPTHPTVATDTRWESLHVFKLGRHAIGMTSATTLVSTAADYRQRIRDTAVTWFDGQRLVDPIPMLNAAERLQLVMWLMELTEGLVAHPAKIDTTPRWNRLLHTITQFSEALGGAAQVVDQGQWDEGGLGLAGGVFGLLDRCAPAVAAVPEQSHVRVIPTTPGRNPARPLLLVDPGIAQDWNLPPQGILVIGGATLSAAPPNAVVGQHNTFGGQPITGCDLWGGQDLFEQELWVVGDPDGDAVPGAQGFGQEAVGNGLTWQGERVTPLVPLKPILLDHLTAGDLAARVRFQQQNNDIVVTVRLTLTGPDGQGRDYRIRKIYQATAGVINRVVNVPNLEVWPNFEFKDGGWKKYYTYYRSPGTHTFYATPLRAGTEGARYVREDPATNAVAVEVREFSAFPEAMACRTQRANDAQDGLEEVSAGLLLLKRPERISLGPQAINIGIDFGTSSTTVYARLSDGVPRKVTLESLLFPVTNDAVQRTYLFEDFFSPLETTTPLLSLFIAPAQQAMPGDMVRAVIDGHVCHYVEKPDGMPTALISTNLKWGDVHVRKRAAAFLSQLGLQCAAFAATEQVGRVSWRFAYPTQFSEADTQQFTNIWNTISEEISEDTGVMAAEPHPQPQTESVAAGRFLANYPEIKQAAPFERGVVCIDIGGGTSDISVWQGAANGLRFQSSLMFAGRNLFGDYLDDSVAEALRLVTEPVGDPHDPTARYAAIDAALQARAPGNLDMTTGALLFRELPNLIADPTIATFVQKVAVGVAGLLYYVGLILKSLASQNLYTPSLPDIYIVGNGSQILHWLSAGRFQDVEGENAATLLKTMVRKASGFGDSPFGIVVSSLPKEEVAYGLVSDAVQLRFDPSLQGFIAGEQTHDVDAERTFSWEERLTAERLTRGNGIRLESLQQCNTFLKIFSEKCQAAGLPPYTVNHDSLRRTQEQVDTELGFASTKEPHEVRVDPLFIKALKHYMQL